jgi:hypothetical protein
MNPNQMMIAKAMVAQSALRDEAIESRRRALNGRRNRTSRDHAGVPGLLRRR